MKAIAFSLQKGGVSKTSLAGSVGYALADKGRTCLVDCDPQGNLSSWLVKGTPVHELADVLTRKADLAESLAETPRKGLAILPTFGLDGGLRPYAENRLSDEPFIFADLVEALEQEGVEYVVFDLSPSIGRLERAVLYACQEVITPMTPEYFSLDGISIFQHELERLRKNLKRGPGFGRIAITMYDQRIGQHQTIRAEAQKILVGYDLYIFPVDPVFRKAQAGHRFIQQNKGQDAAKPETLAEILRLTEDLCRR